MKVLLCLAAGVLCCPFALSSASSQGTAVQTDPSFSPFLGQFEQGISRFLNGDATLWKQNASHREDVTIMGAWGAHEKGWNEVGPRYDWAATRFQAGGAAVKTEYLASGVSGDLAYTVTIERSEVLLVGEDQPASMILRVTHLFRKEADGWKLVHRHADPLMTKTAPSTVLRK